MAPPAPAVTTTGFFDNLPYRPQLGKREGTGSLPVDLANFEEDVDEYFARNTKSDEDHAAERRRVNNPSEKINLFHNLKLACWVLLTHDCPRASQNDHHELRSPIHWMEHRLPHGKRHAGSGIELKKGLETTCDRCSHPENLQLRHSTVWCIDVPGVRAF